MREISIELWVSALCRRAQLGGAFATVVRRGDRERGDVLIKVRTPDGQARLFTPGVSADGSAVFDVVPARGESLPEAEADAMIERRTGYDRDLWVVEIEDRDGRHFLTESVRD